MAYEKLSDNRTGDPSERIQRRRFSNGKTPTWLTALQPSKLTLQPIACNSDMRPAEVRQYCTLDDTGAP